MRDVILQNISEYFLRINFETENCAAQFSSRFSSRMEAVFHFLQQYIRGQFLRNVEEGVSFHSPPCSAEWEEGSLRGADTLLLCFSCVKVGGVKLLLL